MCNYFHLVQFVLLGTQGIGLSQFQSHPVLSLNSCEGVSGQLAGRTVLLFSESFVGEELG